MLVLPEVRAKITEPHQRLANLGIEAKAATQLGENVKLLKYISIFYLPLSFCTVSLGSFSINNYCLYLDSHYGAFPALPTIPH